MPVPAVPPPSLIALVWQWLSGVAGGAFVGFLFSALLQRSKSSRDELHVACTELCQVLTTAGDVASQYWLLAPTSPEIPELEIRIHGFQRRLSGYGALLRRRLHEEGAGQIDHAMTRLFDALSGGDFGDRNRPADRARALAAQDRAADGILAVRRAFLDKMDGWKMLGRQFRPSPRRRPAGAKRVRFQRGL
jgi:hypothetical protein